MHSSPVQTPKSGSEVVARTVVKLATDCADRSMPPIYNDEDYPQRHDEQRRDVSRKPDEIVRTQEIEIHEANEQDQGNEGDPVKVMFDFFQLHCVALRSYGG